MHKLEMPISFFCEGAVVEIEYPFEDLFMESLMQKSVDIYQLRNMLNKANDIEGIKALNSFIPELSLEEKLIARRNLDDGIYDAYGTLIGEKHPDD